MMEEVLDKNKTNTAEISLKETLEEYWRDLQALNRSDRTVSWYRDILKRYFSFLEENGWLKPLPELGRKDLSEYLLHLQKTPKWPNRPQAKRDNIKLSPYSVQGHARAIKAFWGWLLREGYITQNPLERFRLPKVPQNLIRVISPKQFETLLRHIDRTTSTGAKYYCILLLLFDTGMRISELTKIKIEDIGIGGNFIRLMGKGLKERLVPILVSTRREINRYVRNFRAQPDAADSPYLFPNPRGGPITIGSVQQSLKRLVKKAGLDGVRVSCHIFRHSFATHSLNNGANVFFLKEVMGHSSLLTTLKYTHLQPNDLERAHAMYSPLKDLGIGRAGRAKC